MSNKLNGFIKVHRRMIEWGWYSDPNTKALFLHLLLVATFKDGEYMGHKLKPGDAVVGFKSLSETLGMSVKQVRTAMAHLESTGEITRKATNRFSIVSIANWESYQLEDDERANKGQTKGKQRANKGQHLKNVKNVKNIYNPPGKYIPEPPKYPAFKPEEKVDAVPMPDHIREKIRKTKND